MCRIVAFILYGVLMGVWSPAPNAAELNTWKNGAAPPLALRDLRGTKHDLRDYRGKVVLVNFWATWCEPCRSEMPSMHRLEQTLKGQPFVVLAVNADEPEARIRKFLHEVPLDFTVLLDPDMMTARAWGARILPASFVVDREGRLRYGARGEMDWTDPRVVGAIRTLIDDQSS